MELTATWSSLFKLLLALLLVYGLLYILDRFFQRIITKNSLRRKFKEVFQILITVFRPVAALFLLIYFVSINYIVHGILIALVVVIGFPYIRSYINGLLLRMNPLVDLGVQLSTASHKGEIVKFLFLGVIINEAEGERFINYTEIASRGFGISRKETGSLRSSMAIFSEMSDEQILDLVFQTPLVNHQQKPILRNISGEKEKKLLFTLEEGVKTEIFLDYLKQYEIEVKDL